MTGQREDKSRNTTKSFTSKSKGDKMSDLWSVRNNGTHKGAWGMPRLSEAKKDVTSCEKLRRVANTP